MAEDDWFRSSAWDEQAQVLFRKKLASARTQKWFYLRVKADAIAEDHPQDALALYQEYLDAQDDDVPPILYAMAIIHWKQGREDELFSCLDRAMGSQGMGLGAMGVMENAFISALLGREDRYARAMDLFRPFDAAAQAQAGRPFARSFAGAFGSAIILKHLGEREQAREAARIALEWMERDTGPIPGHPKLGLPPQVPQEWQDMMGRIAQN